MIKYIKELELENEKLKSEKTRLIKENKKLEIKLNKKLNAGRREIVISEADKELIKMYRIQKYSINELANMFNCSKGTMHKWIKSYRLDE